MQVEPTQEATILKLRQQLVASLALVSSRRQQLLHQLQSTPQALGVDTREFGSNLGVVDAITEQLQGCVTQEDELFFDYLTTISLTVGHFSVCLQGSLCCTCLILQRWFTMVIIWFDS